MKINYLQASNIICFKYVDDIATASKIEFDRNLSILIGQNGSGKSTVLELVNFIFKKVLFSPYSFNRDYYLKRLELELDNKKKTVLNSVKQDYNGFRLEPNWNTEQSTQKIRLEIELDDIDKSNLQLLIDNKDKLVTLIGLYTQENIFSSEDFQDKYVIDIELNPQSKTFTFSSFNDLGFTYLTRYFFYKKLIDIYNLENDSDQIPALHEPFALIGGYRNYHTFTTSVSLSGDNNALKQIDIIIEGEYLKSINTSEQAEPTIFSLVRLRMAEICQNLITTQLDKSQCEEKANNQDFVLSINDKLKIVNLKIEITLDDVPSWAYSFRFIDTKRNKVLADINSLSAGQKAITHLVFEAYGRGDLKGGVVIIDEPEIHLHYQFQNEYLRVIEKLNAEQGCQYILVTHSESLINSETINSVVRLSLDEEGYTKVNKPNISTNQKWLVKILDNKRSTHAFFGSRVLLVEGDTDRYFFRAVLGEIEGKLKRGIVQDVTVLDINDKKKDAEWRVLFDAFGLQTFFITDLDYAFKFYPTETATKVNTQALATQFLTNHPDVTTKIEAEYPNGTFVLKEGDLEIYLGIQKDLTNVINFCQNNLKTFLANTTDSKVKELRMIMSQVTGESESNLF